MSDLSTLAKDFEQRSKQQASAITESVKTAFEKHESDLLKVLNESASTTASAIRDKHRSLQALVIKGWLWLVLSLLLIFSSSLGVLLWTGQKVAKNLAQLEEQKALLLVPGLNIQRGSEEGVLYMMLPKGAVQPSVSQSSQSNYKDRWVIKMQTK